MFQRRAVHERTDSCADMMHTSATGRYELTAVLTHKGRSADSGHYVAWVKQPDGKWIQFDDDKVNLEKQSPKQCH